MSAAARARISRLNLRVCDRLHGAPTAKKLVVFPQRRRPFLAHLGRAGHLLSCPLSEAYLPRGSSSRQGNSLPKAVQRTHTGRPRRNRPSIPRWGGGSTPQEKSLTVSVLKTNVEESTLAGHPVDPPIKILGANSSLYSFLYSPGFFGHGAPRCTVTN